MAAIRFRDLVKMAGTPEPKSLWADPKNDRDFMRAVKQKRVLTVVQESRRKDFGELGFHQHPGALYFIFPKSLPAEKGRVIGIKYDLAEAAEPADVISPAELKREAKQKAGKASKPKKAKPVRVEFYAVRGIAGLGAVTLSAHLFGAGFVALSPASISGVAVRTSLYSTSPEFSPFNFGPA
jgi:hypothetical protein